MRSVRKPIPYGRQTVGWREAHAAHKAVRSALITQGPLVEELEARICEWTGARFAVVVNSGTAALHIAALAANLSESGPTIVPSLTFAATASSVLLAGGHPLIADISPQTWNLDFSLIPKGTKSVVTVDFAGLPSGVESSDLVAAGTTVIEDCAHSLGASTPRGPVGNCAGSDMACFSLHPVKSITSGEGGFVTTNSERLANLLRGFRSHGIRRGVSDQAWEYEIDDIGLNYRLTDIQASIALVQMRRLEGFINRRNEIADRYRELLAGADISLPPAAGPGYRHSYHLFPVLLASAAERNAVYANLMEQGIVTQVHYKPLHRLGAFRNERFHHGLLEVSSDVGDTILSLPIFPGLTKTKQRYVVSALHRAIDGFRRP